MKASMEIVQCFGYFDPPTSCLYLALYQVDSMAIVM